VEPKTNGGAMSSVFLNLLLCSDALINASGCIASYKWTYADVKASVNVIIYHKPAFFLLIAIGVTKNP
jgi:hypothetical protein